jgi:hypothetical protein
MEIQNFILGNSELFRIIYGLVIGLICITIFLKTDKFFKLSFHEGIRYFRNAFFFYGLAFVVRYFLGVLLVPSVDYLFILILFEYFIVLAGFSLFYSLIWKKFHFYNSSIFNSKMIFFHIIAITIALLDAFFIIGNFMFYSQIIIFSFASIIAYKNYTKNKKQKFSKFYFIAMFLELFAWIFNLITVSIFEHNPLLLFNIGIINVIFFLLILCGVLKITKNGCKKT